MCSAEGIRFQFHYSSIAIDCLQLSKVGTDRRVFSAPSNGISLTERSTVLLCYGPNEGCMRLVLNDQLRCTELIGYANETTRCAEIYKRVL
jgi:hypothetical protein